MSAATAPAADIHDTDVRQRMSAGALRTWFQIAGDWRLRDRDGARLLGAPESTYRRWKRKPEVTLDIGQIERLSLLLGIYKALQILLPRADAADGWVRQANDNPLFNGQTPLERMLGGLTEDLAVVRRHLDSQRSGWA